jgi:hypothetical protein
MCDINTNIQLFIRFQSRSHSSVIRALFIMGKQSVEADRRGSKRRVQADSGEEGVNKRKTLAAVCYSPFLSDLVETLSEFGSQRNNCTTIPTNSSFDPEHAVQHFQIYQTSVQKTTSSF